MMRIYFIAFALLLSGLLTGCGFSPMHSKVGANAPLSNIDLQLEKGTAIVDNQAGFFVLQRLKDRIGTPTTTAPYQLKISPKYSRRRLGITNADVASRYDITVQARWELIDAKTGKTLKRGRSQSVGTFGAPEGPFGVITADNVGVEHSSKETADRLLIQLAQYFAEENKKAQK